MPRYFRKEEPRVKLHLPNGGSLKFDFNTRDHAWIKTEHGWLITELEKSMHRGVGGIMEVTEAEYSEAQKKRVPFNLPSRQREMVGPSRQTVRGVPPWQSGVAGLANTQAATMRAPESSGVATPQRSEGLRVEKKFVKPTAGKIPVFEDNT